MLCKYIKMSIIFNQYKYERKNRKKKQNSLRNSYSVMMRQKIQANVLLNWYTQCTVYILYIHI